jgi:hypothetical protein
MIEDCLARIFLVLYGPQDSHIKRFVGYQKVIGTFVLLAKSVYPVPRLMKILITVRGTVIYGLGTVCQGMTITYTQRMANDILQVSALKSPEMFLFLFFARRAVKDTASKLFLLQGHLYLQCLVFKIDPYDYLLVTYVLNQSVEFIDF